MIYVGGLPHQRTQIQHFIECVWRDERFQATNVLALRPGRIVMFEGCEATQRALESHGIEVVAVPARNLVYWAGGPHCMVMPLERQNL